MTKTSCNPLIYDWIVLNSREPWVCLTDEAAQPQRPLGGRSVAAEEVDRNSWQGDADADQGVDGVAVEGHHHQEDGEEAENDGVDQAELWEGKTRDEDLSL